VDEATAKEYGLTCQIDGMSSYYTYTNWYCADLTSEEYNTIKNKIPHNRFKSFSSGSTAAEVSEVVQYIYTANTILRLTVWRRVNKPTPKLLTISKIVQALVRPVTPAHSSLKDIETKLFTSTFLPSSEITAFLRALLWTVPVPELSVLIFDWSSLTPRSGIVSPIASAVIEAVFRGDLKAAKKLVFAQTLTSGQGNISSDSLIIGQRNDFAMESILHSIGEEDCTSIALLYGALHCRDLQNKLENLGFVQTHEQWKTAWSAEVSSLSTSSKSSPKQLSLTSSISLLVLVFYLVVSGADWFTTVGDTLSRVVEKKDFTASVAIVGLYLLRHLIFYFGLSKLIVQWDVFPFEFDEE